MLSASTSFSACRVRVAARSRTEEPNSRRAGRKDDGDELRESGWKGVCNQDSTLIPAYPLTCWEE